MQMRQGNYSITLDKAYLNGENLIATATDQSGNKTEAKKLLFQISHHRFYINQLFKVDGLRGKIVQGTTEANVTVTIKNATGDVIGSA